MKEIEFTIDESNDKENKRVGIALVVHDKDVFGKIEKIKNKLHLRFSDNISKKLKYHFSEDTGSLSSSIIKEISKLNIVSYSVIGFLRENVNNNQIYQTYFNDLLKPILMKYEKMGYQLFNLNFENLSEKIEKDRAEFIENLSEDVFFKKRIKEGVIKVNVIKKEKLLTILPDYIIGVLLLSLKSKNREPGSLSSTCLHDMKNKISRVKIISDKTRWYDFKKQNDYDDFVKLE